MNHGHVTPNADGSRARCGGPGMCSECSVELAQKSRLTAPSVGDEELDCGDNSCAFAKDKNGMRTNGGCHCFSNAGFSRSVIASAHQMLPELLSLRHARSESQAEIARLRSRCADGTHRCACDAVATRNTVPDPTPQDVVERMREERDQWKRHYEARDSQTQYYLETISSLEKERDAYRDALRTIAKPLEDFEKSNHKPYCEWFQGVARQALAKFGKGE